MRIAFWFAVGLIAMFEGIILSHDRDPFWAAYGFVIAALGLFLTFYALGRWHRT